jgi:fucose permease
MTTTSVLVTAHAAFLLVGTVTTLLGPLLPVLAARWLLNDASAGLLFTAQFTGSMVGVGISGTLVSSRGFRSALIAGLTVMAAGVGALGFATWPWALASVAAYGVGLGISIPATNLLVARAAHHRGAAALNLLNLAWGLGAVAAPPAIAWCAAHGSVDWFLFGLAASILAMMVILALTVSNEPLRDAAGGGEAPLDRRSPVFLTYAALFYVYVGTENAIAGWVGRFAQQLDATPVAAATPAFFWGGLLTGRAAAAFLLRRYPDTILIQSGLTLAAAAVGLVLVATSHEGVAAGSVLCGLGLSSVFPTTIAQLSLRFGDAAPRAAAVAFTMAGLGGATIPWFVGAVSTATGSLRAGLMLPVAGCLVMIALHRYRAAHGG